MPDARVDGYLQLHQRLKNGRSEFDATWQDIAEQIAPRKAKFTKKPQANETKGQRITRRIFDAVPALALERFAAAVHSLVTPRNIVWQRLKASEEELNDSIEVQRYFETVNKRLYAARYGANFDNQVHECYNDLGAFATMGLYVGDTRRSLLYSSIPLYSFYIMENADGVVDLATREYMMTARNAVKEFDRAKLSDGIKRAASEKPETEFCFIDVIKPIEESDYSEATAPGMSYVQCTISPDSRDIVLEEGYRVFPIAVNRYALSPGDVYGRGPAELVLPDVRMLNEMNKTTMQGAQLRAMPPILAPHDSVIQAIRLTPAAVNYGAVDMQGRALLQPLQAGGDVGLGLEMMDQKRKVVQDAFWNTLFQILVDTPAMTATEAMLRAQEKGALLAPTASRIESEFLKRIVDCELDVLEFRGLLPPKPRELVAAGNGFTIEYDSPMARARKQEDGIAIMRTIEQLTPLAGAMGDKGASVFRRFNLDQVAKTLANVNGVPAICQYSDDELAEQQAQEAQAAQTQQIIDAAPAAAAAAKDLATAQAVANQPPSAVVPQ